MSNILIKNATIVNEGKRFIGNVLIENEFIKELSEKEIDFDGNVKVIDATGLLLLPG